MQPAVSGHIAVPYYPHPHAYPIGPAMVPVHPGLMSPPQVSPTHATTPTSTPTEQTTTNTHMMKTRARGACSSDDAEEGEVKVTGTFCDQT